MRRRHNPTEEQHQRAIVAAAAAEQAKMDRLAALEPDELNRKKRLAAYGIDPEPPTLLQMINDYLQLVNIGGQCWGAVYVVRAERRIAARKEADQRRIAALDEVVVPAPGKV